MKQLNQIYIKTPATTANLGPGFDVFGLALNLYNEFLISYSKKEYEIYIKGFSANSLTNIDDNLLIKSYRYICQKYDWSEKPLILECNNQIPLHSGLGSSATAILAGIIAAKKLNGYKIDSQEILEDALEIETHPDNLSACLFGGFTISTQTEQTPLIYKTKINHPLCCWVLYPEKKVDTHESRKKIPHLISHKDAIYSMARAAMFVAAFIQGKWEYFFEGMKDKLHEPYRMDPNMEYPKLKESLKGKEFYGWAISGSGPSVIIFCEKITKKMMDAIDEHFNQKETSYTSYELSIDNQGVIIS